MGFYIGSNYSKGMNMDQAVERASKLDTATISDALDKLGIKGQCLGIKPRDHSFRMTGRSYTIQYGPADVEPGTVGDYIDDLEPGTVVVLDNGGREDATVWGDILTCAAQERGINGLVLDGCVRDADDIDALNFPIFSRGLNILGTGKERGGSIGSPIRIGEVDIKLGDVVIGDRDGVVIIPANKLEVVIEASYAREEKEDEVRRRLKNGESSLEIYKFP
jgi:regulator of RNase E activity RraA